MYITYTYIVHVRGMRVSEGRARRGEKLLFSVQQQMFHIRERPSARARPGPMCIPNRSCFDGEERKNVYRKSLLLSLRVIANS